MTTVSLAMLCIAKRLKMISLYNHNCHIAMLKRAWERNINQ